MPKVGEAGRVSDMTTPGYVYFIQAGRKGRIKIGWSSNVAKRLGNLQTACPEDLELLHSEPGTGRDERDLHNRFRQFHWRGEWFTPNSAIFNYIAGRRMTHGMERGQNSANSPTNQVPHLSEEEWAQIRACKAFPPGYWDYGSPGWGRLMKASEALG